MSAEEPLIDLQRWAGVMIALEEGLWRAYSFKVMSS
jgi:hypothetical protein